MKILSYVGLTICAFIFMSSPKTDSLSNTTWSGYLNLPDPYDATLKFTEDTLFVYLNTDLIETSLYSVKSDTLSITKLSGNSLCTDGVGKFAFEINKDMLMIVPITDLCEGRFYAFDEFGYKRKE